MLRGSLLTTCLVDFDDSGQYVILSLLKRQGVESLSVFGVLKPWFVVTITSCREVSLCVSLRNHFLIRKEG